MSAEKFYCIKNVLGGGNEVKTGAGKLDIGKKLSLKIEINSKLTKC